MRTAGDPLALSRSVSAQIPSVDPGQPTYDVRSLAQVFSDNLSGIEGKTYYESKHVNAPGPLGRCVFRSHESVASLSKP